MCRAVATSTHHTPSTDPNFDRLYREVVRPGLKNGRPRTGMGFLGAGQLAPRGLEGGISSQTEGTRLSSSCPTDFLHFIDVRSLFSRR